MRTISSSGISGAQVTSATVTSGSSSDLQSIRVGQRGQSLGLGWLKGYLDAINAGASIDQFLRKLHLELEESVGLRCSEIFIFDTQGNLVHAGAHGLSAEQIRSARLGKDVLHPVTDAARSEQELVIADAAEYLQRYPEMNGASPAAGPAIFIPLRSSSVVDGVFALTFDGEGTIEWRESDELFQAIEVLASVAHLLVSQRSLQSSLGLAGNESAGIASLDLTDRQIAIAKMIADGLTNKNIARELGFSEATIRYETIKLYERLRVKNRSHAAARIHQLGIG
jgi:DNA-binding CsgD family transcriptional regulator